MNELKIGLPKGSLEKPTLELFAKAGWNFQLTSRNYFPVVDDPELHCSICRPQEMSRYIESGLLDAGITGKDWISENQSDLHVVDDLIYSKVSRKPTRWIIAVPGDSDITCLEDLEGKRIATELVGYSTRFFKEKGINVEIEFSWGATEAKVVSGLADAIVEVTETESTIRAHGLRIIHELMSSNSQFVVNRKAWEDPWKRKKIEDMAMLLQGVLRAETLVGLKMNVGKDQVEKIAEMLPSMNGPTISPLYNSEWFSVDTVVSEHEVRVLIPALHAAGAEGIVEYVLNKVV